jgi:predicted tellurium resistance membrane protein TerC
MFSFLDYSLVVSFITLSFLEIILGIDNLIFIAIVVHKLPKAMKKTARIFGLSLALIIRVIMLLALSWVMTLTKPLISLSFADISWKSILLICGGLFLIIKSAVEIKNEFQEVEHSHSTNNKENHKQQKSMLMAIAQISLIDFVFSFDSVITAVGMTNNIPLIVAAIIVSMLVMLACSEHISNFLTKYPSLKIIALAFIFLVGAILVADGFSIEINKTYLYFALFFTRGVEILNIIAKKR